MGKPETALAEALASVTGVPAARTLFVGDRLETDIDMAIAAGMISAMVLTGISTEDDLRDRERRLASRLRAARSAGPAGSARLSRRPPRLTSMVAVI